MAHKSLKSNNPAPRTIAPSQLKKMVRIEHISSSVIPCTARQSFVACGMSVVAGEKYFLVQSDRYQGYAYIVRWNEAFAQYDCSCGNPRCSAHTKHVSAYVHAHPVTEKPVVVSPVVEVPVTDQKAAEEMLELMALSVNQIVERIKIGTKKQKELSRQHKAEYNARLQVIRAEQQEVA
jgi:hypothetical protein